MFHLLLSVVRNKITAIFIGAAGIGAADIYSKIAEFIGHLTQLGLGVSGVRRIAQLYESDPKGKALLHNISTLRSWVLVTAVLGAVFMLLLAAVFPVVLSAALLALFVFRLILLGLVGLFLRLLAILRLGVLIVSIPPVATTMMTVAVAASAAAALVVAVCYGLFVFLFFHRIISV